MGRLVYTKSNANVVPFCEKMSRRASSRVAFPESLTERSSRRYLVSMQTKEQG